ncbi:hypothetical protein [Alkalibaculum bacchi]|uniref:hypothetical protein n=1 Tax=Alkalibaculum bacchi TaxID=645887 RepID=UPI0026EE6F22|nr:hypothetical protein [Alkalibaculum bacchi]
MKRDMALYTILVFVFSFVINVGYSYIGFVKAGFDLTSLVEANAIMFWYITPMFIVLLKLFIHDIGRKQRYLLALIALLIVGYINMWLNNHYLYVYDKLDNLAGFIFTPLLQTAIVIFYDLVISSISKFINKI